MSRAYAHVITEDFGKAASELTQSLINIGFNPMEAATAIRKEKPQQDLKLEGGKTAPLELPKVRFEVSKEPDLSGIPERDKERVLYMPNAEGAGGTVEVVDELDVLTVDALVETVPAKQREEFASKIERHQQATIAAKAPSERGEVFEVPRLCLMDQGELELVDRGAVLANFTWDLLDTPADLTSFRFDEASMTFEVFLEGEKVQYHPIRDDVATYMPGFAQDRTLADLLGWLDHEIREPSIRQASLREWLRRAITGLLDDRGFSLAQLLKGQFVLRRKLREQLDAAKTAAYRRGFQQALFDGAVEIVTTSEPDHAFSYPADMSLYPAQTYYQGSYRFRKHYYPVPGDLRWKTGAGVEAEEYLCAQAIDLLEEVQFWVRNLVHSSQFWMPTSRMRTYPDFVARLRDGRLFVVEYKGGDRFTNADSEEKRMVGELWAQGSGGRGVYMMVQKKDEKGKNVRDQLLAAIALH